MTVKKASSSLSVCLLTESEIAHICPCYSQKYFWRDVFHRGVALAHTVNQGVIFPFSVWEL